jgi:hypothetical protein
MTCQRVRYRLWLLLLVSEDKKMETFLQWFRVFKVVKFSANLVVVPKVNHLKVSFQCLLPRGLRAASEEKLKLLTNENQATCSQSSLPS